MKVRKILRESGFKLNEKNIEEVIQQIIAESSKRAIRIEITYKTVDGIQYESDTFESELLKNKKIVYIEVWAYCVSSNISLEIDHGVGGEFYLSIEGPEKWVNSLYQSIEDMTSHWEKQTTWVKKYYIVPIIMGFFIFYFLIQFSVELVTYLKIDNEGIKFLINMLYFPIAFVCIFFIIDQINKLFPDMEFNFGPEHLKTENKKRERVASIIAIIVIPALLWILSLFIK